MMEIIQGLPAATLGVRASGEVTAEDYEQVLMPALESLLQQHASIRMLYQTTPDLSGFTAGAMWDDARVGLAHLRSFERIAVVTDTEWVATGIKLFRFLLPCPIKLFSNSQLEQARNWLAAEQA